MDGLDYELPAGLAFAHLKGLVCLMNTQLDSGTPEGLHYARCHLHEAVLYYEKADTVEFDGLVPKVMDDPIMLLEIATNKLRQEMKRNTK